MSRLGCLIAGFVAGSFCVTTATDAATPLPNAVLHSVFNPGTNVQTDTREGWSVAVDGNVAVAGAPYASTSGLHSGEVRVYDAMSGLLHHKLYNPSLPQGSDLFGFAVAVVGAKVVVGAPGAYAWDGQLGASLAGVVYVYHLTGATPTRPMITLTNPSPAESDLFGSAVAISGTRVVVGAYGDTAGARFAGSAYVYDLTGATPTVPVITLTNPSPAQFDSFGRSVAISDTRVVVGAFQDDTGATNAGVVYAYDLATAIPATPWLTLTNPSPADGDLFGASLAISGTRVVIGVQRDDTGATNAGGAYVYDLASTIPTSPVLTLPNPDPAAHYNFGFAVAISGARVAIGAVWADAGAEDAGKAYLYDLGSATPTVPVVTLSNPHPATKDNFGHSVAISGTRAVVGAPSDDTGGTDTGGAHVYDFDAAMPMRPAVTLRTASLMPGDRFGISVAMSGTRVVVGAAGNDSGARDTGSAYVYDLARVTPTVPLAVLNNPAPAINDAFGWAVSISDNWLVVGAPVDDTGAGQAGGVYVYDLAGDIPSAPAITLTNPSPATLDSFGLSVAISDQRIVVGAPADRLGPPEGGGAYVYDLASATPSVPAIRLINPSPLFDDEFGSAVAISGARVVIGAWNAGSACVYDMAGATPALPLTTLLDPKPGSSGRFGYAVAISDTRVVVGAPLHWIAGLYVGIAYVYHLTSATPAVPVTTLTNPCPTEFGQFGSSVGILGTRVAVGAVGQRSVYVYELTSDAPTVPVATLRNTSPGSYSVFGVSVAVSSATVVASDSNDDTIAPNRGAAYIFGLVPELRIFPAAPGLATVSWTPATSSGFVLQYAERLVPTNWLNAPSGELNPVTISTTNAARFYRLIQP